MSRTLLAAGVVVLVTSFALFLRFGEAADDKPGVPPSGPLTPREELATFKVPKGFHVELVASEPDVIDPVAMAFDEEGRIFVAEMRGYPNAGVGTGYITSGRIKLLEDKDGTGVYTKSTIWADNLRFPTGVMPWRGGLLVANAPELLYLEDTKGEGKADKRRALYTDFYLANIQQLVNCLQYGYDNWVYGCAGSDGGLVKSAEKSDLPPVNLRARGIRFHPDVPGSLEPTSGGGQYGLAPDDWGRWFVNTNSQHLRHIILPDHYLRRNPSLPVSAVTLDIPDHGAACKVFRISPFEQWRVERTTRRKEGPDASRFPPTELFPGGYITSGCSPLVYTADAYPEAYRGNTFICDPANNLIHHDVLVPNGATFIAKRGEEDCEFLASTDTWFRPVHLTIGPDGAIYVLDFYREVIESPLSLPDDIKKKLNLESRGRGRIWRIVADNADKKDAKKRNPSLRKAATQDLVAQLADGNSWWRLTAQRLLAERQDRDAVKPLEELAKTSKSALGRAHALWTLAGLKALDDSLIEKALSDPEAGVREQALQLAEPRLQESEPLRTAAVKRADDPSSRVRFQAAFTLGETNAPEALAALAKIAKHPDTDSWTQTAVLSSVSKTAPQLLETLGRDAGFTKKPSANQLQMLTRLAALVATKADDADLGRALALLKVPEKQTPQAWQLAVLDGLGQGARNSSRPLAKLWEEPPPALKDAVAQARSLFEQAAATARNDKQTVEERVSSARLLAYGPFMLASATLPDLLTPQTPSDLQMNAVRALAQHDSPKVAEMLLASWTGFSPAVRREAVEGLFARPQRLTKLLDAIEAKKIPANQIEPFRLDQLRKHPNTTIRQRAQKLLAGQLTPDRQKVVENYKAALELTADKERGKAAFKKNCATCHRLENVGVEVGPDLLSALRNKSREQLVIDIMDPSREVDPRYLNYLVTTKKGQTLSGMIVSETASSVTLRRAEKAEDVILRSQIDDIQGTAKSVMPENLETQLTKQDLADLIAYLQAVAVPK
jgi:putative membrane-bound dehydrogenase-like protein